jgi:PAS domain S-box-containing protein
MNEADKIIQHENYIEHIFMQAPLAMLMLKEKAYEVEMVNDLMLQVLGKDKSIVNKPFFEFMPEMKVQLKASMNNVFNTGIAYYGNEFETTITKNGEKENHFFTFVFHPKKEIDNRISGIIVIANDITDQVNARKKIEEVEHRYHEIIHSSTSLIALLQGTDFIITMANDAIIKQWGKGNDVIGKPFLALLPELDAQGFGKLLRNVLDTGTPYFAYEMPIELDRNGVTRLSYFNFIYQAQRNINNEICGVAIIATEVNSQALLHVQIKESEERFRTLSDNVPMFIFLVDPNEDATISFWNKTWLDYTGQTFDEALGNAWNGIIHPDDVPSVMEVYVPAFKKREAYLLPGIRVKRHDGVYRWYQVKANPRYLHNGDFMGYIGTGFDVHEQKLKEDTLKQSEEKLKSLIDKSPVPICILSGEDMRLDLANELVLKIWNVGKEAIGKPFLEIVPEMVGQPFLALLLDVYHTGVTHTGNEVPAFFINANGEKVHYFFNFVYQPSYQADGVITGVMVRATDVTEQVIARNLNKEIYETQAKRLEEKVLERTLALNVANEELQQKNKEIAFSKYNKIFLTEFSEKFSGNNAQKEFFNSLVKFISDITKLDYAFVAKFKNQGKDKFTLETIAVSELGEPIENFDYSLIDGPCKQIVYGNMHQYAEAVKTIFPTSQIVLKFNVEGYIGVPLYNTKNEVIGLLAVMHTKKIENVETVNSILKITAKRTELEFERIDNEEKLTSNNEILEEKNLLLIESNKLLVQKNKEIEQANEKLLNDYARSLIEASQDPLVTISTNGKIMDMNEAMVEVTDKSRAQLKDTDFKNYFTDKEKAKAVYEEVFEKGFVTDYPLTMIDGKLTDVLFNGSVYKDAKGNVQGAVVVARDVMEQKKIENDLIQSLKEVSDYKYALDASSIVEVTDEQGTIKYVNENFCKISKYTAEELIGNTHFMINSGYHSKAFMNSLWGTISNGKIWRDEIKNRAKDGSYYWVLTTIVPFLNKAGKPYQYVAIRTDITNQKRIEKELTEAKTFAEIATGVAEDQKLKAQEATLMAENATKAKQQFLSNMSHEIRTPMNAIIGFTKVVLKTELNAKQKEYLSAIKMSGDALIVLINDILDLAKVDAGKMEFEKIPFKLSLSIDAMLHLFESKIQEKNLSLVVDYDKTIPTILLGDPVRLHQIILNLISNALKFTQEGTITVSVKMLGEDDEKATIEFTIADTGIGIAAEKIDKIFENFQQATKDTSRLYGGTGLGLAIVKQLVNLQGGDIAVKSKIDEGATFSFILNFDKSNSEEILETEIMELDEDVKNIKILVAEDMPLNQLLMKTLLDDFGFESDIIANGKLAIEKLPTKNYDIILMDLQMPEMNGFETTEYIRNTLKSTIPIVALTADVTTVDVEKCKAIGMNDYIAKPVDERLLYSKIMALVKKPVVIVSKELLIEAIEEHKIIKCIDLKYLSTRTKSNPVLMMEMMAIYLEQTPPLIGMMKESYVSKDWEKLDAAVHKMIPSFSIMGMNMKYEDIAKKIQRYAAAKKEEETMHSLITQLENVLMQSCKELEIEFNHLKNSKQ